LRIQINIPKSWNELNDSQFFKLAKLIYNSKNDKRFDLKCFLILLNIKFWQFKKIINSFIIFHQVPVSELKHFYKFIYTNNDRTIFPKIIKGFHAPMPKLTNLTVEEFSAADDLHIKWRNTKNIEFLVYLAATLYSKELNPRDKFDKNNLPQKIKYFSRIPVEKLIAVELAYFGSKNLIVKRYPKAFPQNVKKSNSKYGFGKVILQMAGGKFGNHEQTKTTNVYTFLEEFNENLKSKL
jgi:hypothetical protein